MNKNVGHCPYCHGTSLLHREGNKIVGCAHCGGAGYLTENSPVTSKIKWIEVEKAFDIDFSLPVESQAGKDMLLANLPARIAEESQCSCGEKLSLGNHDIQVNDQSVQFKGYFYCSSCLSSNWFRRFFLKKGLMKFLGSISKVKVGPEGVEIERSKIP